MKACVLDTSVAVKWFLPPENEPLTDEALHILAEYRAQRFEFIVPDLFWPEFGSVMWKAVRQKRITVSFADECIRRLKNVQIRIEPTAPLLEKAFAIATTFERSVYDGIFVALAIASTTPFLTADERLVNALGSRFPIQWLGGL